MALARSMSGPMGSSLGKSQPMTLMPAAWAAGRILSMKGATLKPSHAEPMRTQRWVRPVSLALAMMAGTLPPSVLSGR
jgi:hypothetical protein